MVVVGKVNGDDGGEWQCLCRWWLWVWRVDGGRRDDVMTVIMFRDADGCVDLRLLCSTPVLALSDNTQPQIEGLNPKSTRTRYNYILNQVYFQTKAKVSNYAIKIVILERKQTKFTGIGGHECSL